MNSDLEGRPLGLFSVLNNRRFGPYVLGASISNIGTWFQNIAQSVLVYRMTGSTFLVGVVNFSMFISLLIFAPWAGPMADRHDRRRILLTTQFVAFCVALALWFVVAVGAASTGFVVGAALLMGVATAFSVPALQALVPALVPASHLSRALSLNAVSFNLARAVGPVLGAAVVVGLGFSWAFFLNSVSFLAFVVALLVIRPQGSVSITVEPRRLRDTVQMLGEEGRLLGFLVIVALASLTADPINTIGPEFATRIYGFQDTFTGWMIGAFGLGAVAGAVSVSNVEIPRVRLLASMLLVEGLGMCVFGFSEGPVPGLVGLGLAGFGWLAAVMLATTAIQVLVADQHRGRVMAIWSVAFMGVRPISSLTAGLFASVGGPQLSALTFALPAVLGGVYLYSGRSRMSLEA
jgi:MFS family permease